MAQLHMTVAGYHNSRHPPLTELRALERAGLRIAFYAPMKPPDDPVPSGDRLVGGQIMAALSHAGHEVRLASRLRTRLGEADVSAMDRLEGEAAEEQRRLGTALAAPGEWHPDLWFTYHLYYKAPDLIGPALARRLAIPYVAYEASHAAKRDQGPFARWAAHARAAMRDADLLICIGERDRDPLEQLTGRRGQIATLPPFLIEAGPEPEPRRAGVAVKLITVAMMRPGTKAGSYAFLAEALDHVPREGWHLDVIGDGSESDAVRARFARHSGKVTFHGLQTKERVKHALQAADIFVWPGVGEAYGMVFLEAAACGLPSIATRSGGVPEVVKHGRTGILGPDDEPPRFAANIMQIIMDGQLRLKLGAEARRFVTQERSLGFAAATLDDLIRPLVSHEGFAS
jgi:glycosyltransferase involved in cell wall biosynthesis